MPRTTRSSRSASGDDETIGRPNVLVVPRVFAPASQQAFWAEVALRRRSTSAHAGGGLVLDLRLLEDVDPEGVSQLALLPYFLKNAGFRVLLRLPTSTRVATLWRTSGLMDALLRDFGSVSGPEPQSSADSPVPEVQRGSVTAYSNCSESVVLLRQEDVLEHHLLNTFGGQLLRHDAQLGGAASYCFGELVRNIFDHSGDAFGCCTVVADTSPRGPILRFAVSDLGLGINTTIRDLFLEEHITRRTPTDVDLVLYALTPGITCTRNPRRGHGLAQVARLSTSLRIRSGMAVVEIRRGNRRARPVGPPGVPGTSALLEFTV